MITDVFPLAWVLLGLVIGLLLPPVAQRLTGTAYTLYRMCPHCRHFIEINTDNCEHCHRDPARI